MYALQNAAEHDFEPEAAINTNYGRGRPLKAGFLLAEASAI
jgi:hypothetical protein